MASRTIRYIGSIFSCNLPGPIGHSGAATHHPLTPGPTGFNDIHLERQKSFSIIEPDPIPIEPALLSKSRELQGRMMATAEIYFERKDFRWFFAYAHGKMIKLINENIARFQQPNTIMKLNLAFAEGFCQLLEGQSFQRWGQVFSTCHGLEDKSLAKKDSGGAMKFCTSALNTIRKRINFSNAVEKLGNIPPEDYASLQIFLQGGILAALIRLREQSSGSLEDINRELTLMFTAFEAKTWSNAVVHYTDQSPKLARISNYN